MFTQAINLTHLMDEKLDRLISRTPEIRQASFKHVDQVLQERDGTYLFIMPRRLYSIICTLGILVVVILCGSV